MSADRFTEVTSESWFSRIGGAFTGVLIGLVIVLISFPLLFWNEGRAVKTYKTLKEGGGAVVTVLANAVDSGKEGKLVHLTGKADTQATLTDPVFEVSANALHLRRNVEMYQWKEQSHSETRKKFGGGTETVTEYSYSKEWSRSLVKSANFKNESGHYNPDSMPYSALEKTADNVTLEAFVLSPSLVGKISNFKAIEITNETPLPIALQDTAQVHDSGFYIGENPASPQVGDMRVTFQVAKPTQVSIIAKQTGSSFEPYLTTVGGTIELLQVGDHSAVAMIEQAQADNTVLTWLIRIGGIILMIVGFNFIFKPLSVLADVLPIAGTIVGAGTGIIAFLLGTVLSVVTIAIAWIVYRPLLGIILLAVAIGLVVLIKKKLKYAKLTTAHA